MSDYKFVYDTLLFDSKVKTEVCFFAFKGYADNLNTEKYILKCELSRINKSVRVYRSNNSTNVLNGGLQRSPTFLVGRYIYIYYSALHKLS